MGFAILAFVRLLSEQPIGLLWKERKMRASKRATKNSHKSTVHRRNYRQYLAETMWAVGAGVMASPLAALS